MVLRYIAPNGSRIMGPPYTEEEEQELYRRMMAAADPGLCSALLRPRAKRWAWSCRHQSSNPGDDVTDAGGCCSAGRPAAGVSATPAAVAAGTPYFSAF